MTKLSEAELVALVAGQILANQKTGSISQDAIDEATATAVSIVKSAKDAVDKVRPRPQPTVPYSSRSYPGR
jgi:hypothetical protein